MLPAAVTNGSTKTLSLVVTYVPFLWTEVHLTLTLLPRPWKLTLALVCGVRGHHTGPIVLTWVTVTGGDLNLEYSHCNMA